jgi:predicted RNA-binding Zn ribbon-like protein
MKKRARLLISVDLGYGDGMEKDETERGVAAPEDVTALGKKAVRSGKSEADLQAERRRVRAAEKLRENLGRRKQQVRARRAGEEDETDGLPAAKMDES